MAAATEAGAVFLSYASEDKSAAEKIKDALEGAGVDVFFDRDDLQHGDEWEAKLRRSIRQCSLFVPVISQTTRVRDRRFFRLEWNLAVDESMMASFLDEEAFLLPVVIDNTTIDDADVPSKFRAIQWQSLPGGETTPEFVSHVLQLYRKYQMLANETAGVYFCGRLGTYRYYNMDQVVAQALTLYAKITGLSRREALANPA